uniref:hypothetical protein n=1 Tax=Trichocoleus desertorum TaxID=1481672 RepID=UPI0025B29690|nr:hypothetical protein [Trichocoleus desertorum]
MTLSDLLPIVRTLSASDKLRLIRILAEELDTSPNNDIAPLEPFRTYDLPTPYSSFGAGEVLMQGLSQTD